MNINDEKQSKLLRIFGYVLLFVFAYVLYEWMDEEFDHFRTLEGWSMMLGYIAFIFIGITLTIGPIKQWLPGKWSSHLLTFRRDTGIIGGVAAILHVLFVIIIFERGPELFFSDRSSMADADGWLGLFVSQYGLNMSITGIANYMGATAFCFMFALWITSSDRATRILGGAAWKRTHMSNLTIFLLITFHGIIYVGAIKGSPHSYSALIWVTAFVLLMRLAAYITTVLRR